MSDQYIGEIRMFAGNYPPQGWAFCDGQVLSIQGNEALFSLLGTTYGGNGSTTFGLPEMRGRAAMHFGGNHPFGSFGGSETATVETAQLPAHTHAAQSLSEGNTSPDPTGKYWAATATKGYVTSGTTPMSVQAIGGIGAGQAHANMMPFLTLSFIIALEGEYPQRP